MYVEGFLLAVPEANKAQYLEYIQDTSQMFIDHGAARVVENWGDDVQPGKLTSFPQAVDLRDGEVVVLFWIEYADKDVRQRVYEAITKDPRAEAFKTPPFDGARLIFGGFETILDLRAESK
ncbi:MAG: DUF1428 domain-containing protein [Pseudomonadota bacterium]